MGSERYRAEPAQVPVELNVSRMTGGGYALRLRFSAAVAGPCMRCLKHGARRCVEVEAREVDRPGRRRGARQPLCARRDARPGGWARDAFALAMPAKILCREDCAGLCPVCAATSTRPGPSTTTSAAPDPRWAKLRELKLE